MSFASDVKDEVSRIELEPKIRNARLSALIQFLAAIDLTSNGMVLRVKTTNANVAKTVAKDIQSGYGVPTQLAVIANPRFDGRSTYLVQVNQQVRTILSDLDLWTDNGLQAHPRQRFIESEQRVRAYLQGCFMAGGSMNAPSTANYHLEIAVSSPELGTFVIKQMARFNLQAKITTRRKATVVYLKASEQIADFLRCIGASQAVLDFEDVRIQRDFVNNFSRLDNCEIANEVKSMQVAKKQMEAVQLLQDHGLLDSLDEKQKEIAHLRLQHPEATLLELADFYQSNTGIRLSKSGIRHRLLKLMQQAARFQK
jgi:DNA-binding protein WhiA